MTTEKTTDLTLWTFDSKVTSLPFNRLSRFFFFSIRVFSSESVLHIRWPKCCSFSFSPSNEYSVLISFRIDWFDLLAVQGTLKSLLQHHSLKVSILWCSAFFMVQLSHPYVTTGKTKALTRRTFVGKVISLLFNMLCSFLICCVGFLRFSSKEQSVSLVAQLCLTLCDPTNCGVHQASLSIKHLFMAAVTICSDFGAQENKVCYCFQCFPIYLP